MKLSQFIQDYIEEILVEWESFASTLRPAASTMSAAELRDHGLQMLRAIALDIDTGQTEHERDEKSKGDAPDPGGPTTAAARHGTLRETSGFTLSQLTAEFRALRASVLRLWLQSADAGDTTEDILRFNESIDQALAESVETYSAQASRARDIFLAILGHDLRGPLATMTNAGEVLRIEGLSPEDLVKVGHSVKRSAALMSHMVSDLLEYARAELGGKMPLIPRPGDLGEICRSAFQDAGALNPRCPFEFETSGDLAGDFDPVRLQQVVMNLLNNAAQFRGADHPVKTFARGEADFVTVTVANHGAVIAADSLKTIFRPLVQLEVEEDFSSRPTTSLGLGLYVARETTLAHGGSIDVESSLEGGTIFTVRIPRKQTPKSKTEKSCINRE